MEKEISFEWLMPSLYMPYDHVIRLVTRLSEANRISSPNYSAALPDNSTPCSTILARPRSKLAEFEEI